MCELIGSILVVKVLDDHHDFSFACCYSPDGRTLATGNQDKTTRIYDVRHLTAPLHVLGANVGAIRSLHFTKDGRRLAMAGKKVIQSISGDSHSSIEAIDYVHIYDTSDYSSCQVIDFFGDIAGTGKIGCIAMNGRHAHCLMNV